MDKFNLREYLKNNPLLKEEVGDEVKEKLQFFLDLHLDGKEMFGPNPQTDTWYGGEDADSDEEEEDIDFLHKTIQSQGGKIEYEDQEGREGVSNIVFSSEIGKEGYPILSLTYNVDENKTLNEEDESMSMDGLKKLADIKAPKWKKKV